MKSDVFELARERGDRLLGVSVDHDRIVVRKQRVFNAGETGSLAAFENKDGTRFNALMIGMP